MTIIPANHVFLYTLVFNNDNNNCLYSTFKNWVYKVILTGKAEENSSKLKNRNNTNRDECSKHKV